MFSMILLKATERNWELIVPGDWDKRSWKINEDGWYQYKESYRSMSAGVMPEIPDLIEEGILSEDRLKKLKAVVAQHWPDNEVEAWDGVAWEFKLYENGQVSKHRKLGYISDIEPYESIVAVLMDE